MIFKGSGFYITDYRSEGYKEKAKAESGGGEAKKPEGGASTDSKPAEKAAPAAAKPEAKPEAPKSSPPKSDKKGK